MKRGYAYRAPNTVHTDMVDRWVQGQGILVIRVHDTRWAVSDYLDHCVCMHILALEST